MMGIVAVGEGRGFVVQGKERYVITAAHCLPSLPPAHTFRYEEEQTYRLLALLKGSGPDVPLMAELNEGRIVERSRKVPAVTDGPDVQRVLSCCVFVNPVADIAVLGRPDGQLFLDEDEVFDSLVESVPAFGVSPPQDGPASIVALDGELVPCTVRRRGTWVWTSDARTIGGMSGSPVIAPDGSAIGVVVIGWEGGEEKDPEGPHPVLIDQLPGWLINELSVA